ncbi:MAG: RyR domain-containing protein [Pseudomonadota bacterium]
MKKSELNLDTIIEQVNAFKAKRMYYEAYASLMDDMLKSAVKKMGITAIVSCRAKGIPNFAEKIIRKKEEYIDGINQMTDLCGVRVIVNNMDDIQPVCEYIRRNFEIDEANSEDVVDRLGESKFGYRSVHFIVSLKSEEKEKQLLPLCNSTRSKISEEEIDKLLERHEDMVNGQKNPYKGPKFKAEIQIRTLIQHAWAEFAHDQIYKSDFKVPELLQRDANRIAATLEASDEAFARTSRDVKGYRTYYGAYLDQEQMNKEIEKLKAIYSFDENNTHLACQIARMAITIEDWELAHKILEPFALEWKASIDAEELVQYSDELKEAASEKMEEINKELVRLKDPFMAALLHDYSWAGWKIDENEDSLNDIHLASLLDPNNTDIYNSIAEIYKQMGQMEKALSCYEIAFEINPSGPRALAGLIYCKIEIERNIDFIKIMIPALDNCIKTCRKRVDVNVFLPDAFYYSGFFHLVSGRSYDGLNAYAKAVELSTSVSPIRKALSFVSEIEKYSRNGHDIKFEWVRLFLTAAIYAKQNLLNEDTTESLKNLSNLCVKDKEKTYDLAKDKVIIVSGGCDKKVEKKIQEYRSTFNTTFAGFSGIIISGGTQDGISGLVGDLTPDVGCRITKLSYQPDHIPKWTKIHEGYLFKDIKDTGFSALESIQAWIDLFSKGRKPHEIKLIGINGGRISGFEYRMAAAFGALVGIVSDSGRAAHEIIVDKDWKEKKNILALPNDPMTLHFFVSDHKGSDFLNDVDRERLARKAHERFLNEKQDKEYKDSALLPWEKLSDSLKRSNLDQINFISNKLSSVGLSARKKDMENYSAFEGFSEGQVLHMAEMEHARWNIERLKDGWTLGVKDVEKKKSPYIIPWNELTDEIKKYDIDTINNIPEFLDSVGYEIIKNKRDE